MASRYYSTDSQAAAQQDSDVYTAQPTQEHAEITQAYGQQSYGTYGQPPDNSYSQAQTAATYGQTGYAPSYGLLPAGYIPPAAPQEYSQPGQECDTGAYDSITATVTTIRASYAAQFAHDTQPSYPVCGEQPAATVLGRLQDSNESTMTNQPLCSTRGYNQPSLGYGQRDYNYPLIPGNYPVQLVTPPSCPPPIYSFTHPTSYDQSSYSQPNIFGPPSSYGLQSSYGQQRSYGQQLPIGYLPQIGSYSEAPGQYSQQSSSYRPQRSLQQDCLCSMCLYEQQFGGFSRPGENWHMSGPDNWGRGRGRINPGGMSKGGRRGGRGRRGKRGGSNKPSRLTREGAHVNQGPPVDPDEDCNGDIFIQGLNDNVTLDDLAEFFKQSGVVKMIHIYLDEETGKPKGDAMVSYVNPATAKAAVECFDGKDFQGNKLKVSLTKKKPPVNSMQGDMPPSGGRRIPTLHREGPGGPRGPEGTKGRTGGGGGDRGGFPPRGPQGSWGNLSGGRNTQRRARDWQCPIPGCRNHNFSWRTVCNQCKAPRPEAFFPPPFPNPGGAHGIGGPAGMQGGRGGLMDLSGPGGMFRGGRGGYRGSFHGGRGMDRGGFGSGRQGGPGVSLGPLKEQTERKGGGCGGPGKNG